MLESALAYFKYIFNHKKYVLEECLNYGIPLRGLLHDLSKFLPSEFIAYRNYFYGKKPEEGVNPFQELFDFAWLKHQKRNDHHWQYWLLFEDEGGLKPKEMPMAARKEMLADWIGAAKVQGNMNVLGWYRDNKAKMIMAPETRAWVENELETRYQSPPSGIFS